MEPRRLLRGLLVTTALGLPMAAGCSGTTETKPAATEHPGGQGFFGKDGGPSAGPAGGGASRPATPAK